MKCPICRGGAKDEIIRLDCGNFDNSSLYASATIVACKKCGHIYNTLNAKECGGLFAYYNKEYSFINLSSKSFGGDRPGSSDSYSSKRYRNLFKLLRPHLQSNDRILDGGCATGGFLHFLNQKGFKKLSGIDFSRKYVDVAKKSGYTIKLGSVEKIPFKQESFDLVVMDQVLEHLVRPSRAFSEARRVLSPGGLLCISVPDAARYKKHRFFNFWWFLLREHIQHFDLSHLKLLGQFNGFELVDYSLEESPMMSTKMVLPALNVVFRSQSKIVPPTKNLKDLSLKKKILLYIKQENKISEKIKNSLDALSFAKVPLYVYGMGREFLYLYELGLKKCATIAFIDDTPFKQKKLRIDKKRIYGSSTLKNTPTDTNLLITAFAHVSKLKSNLRKVGYKGKVISL